MTLRPRTARRTVLEDLLSHERVLRDAGVEPVAGVDEAGMGPLAGPVVAAAVVLDIEEPIEGIRDSKVLSRLQREALAGRIRRQARALGVGVVDVGEIDATDILQAARKAMRLAVDRLGVRPRHVLVDGRSVPDLDVPQSALVRGDQRVYSIAAASILAKVTRDSIMRELDAEYPGYGFATHVGYGTLFHREALRKLGPSPVHRRSFRLV